MSKKNAMFHEICSDKMECSKNIFDIYEKLNKIRNPLLSRGDKIHINIKNVHDTQKKVDLIVKELKAQKNNKKKNGGGEGLGDEIGGGGGSGEEMGEGLGDEMGEGLEGGGSGEETVCAQRFLDDWEEVEADESDNVLKKYATDENKITIYG